MTEKLKRIQWPGQRILRSVCAVFLCFVIYYLRGQRGIPFYSALAVLQCIQPYHESTVKMGKKRAVGTLIGAFWGMTAILLHIFLESLGFHGEMTHYILVSVFTGIVLYSTVLLKNTENSYFACAVFLSITVIHSTDENPFLFVFDRVLDTIIGVVLALIVNEIHFPRRKNKDILFVSGLDDTLLDSREHLTPYTKVELNRLIEQGMQFTVSTLRTPANVWEVLKGVNLRLPIIAMDGAVLYDMKENKFLETIVMNADASRRIVDFLKEEEMEAFSTLVVDDLLAIYYNVLDNEPKKDIYEKMRRSPYRNYVKRELPEGECVTYFMLIEKKERIEALYRSFEMQPWFADYKIIHYASTDYKGYYYMKIYSKDATREHMLETLKERIGLKRSVTFGSVEGRYDILVENSDRDHMIKRLKKEFEPICWRVKKER